MITTAVMKVARAVDVDDIRIEEVAVPSPGPGEALVRVEVCGICASDVTPWYLKKKCPIVLGHEPAGEIVALGEGVRDFAVGDRVFVHHHAPCGKCRHCQRGFASMCPTWRASNLVPGGLAEYCLVPRVNLEGDTLKLPASMSWEEGSLIEPVATVVRAFRRARVGIGDTVAIIGLGFIGQVMIKLARHYGASRVFACDFVEWRRQRAEAMGADLVVEPAHFAEEIRRINGGELADVVMCGPYKPEVMRASVHYAAPGGTVLFFMAPQPGVELAIEPHHLFFNEISLVSSYSCGPAETREALELLRDKVLRADDLITHRFGLEETGEACRLTSRAQDSLKAVIYPQKARWR